VPRYLGAVRGGGNDASLQPHPHTASYVCAWGPNSEAVEETFDSASFLPEFGEPLPFSLMTTSHRDETPEEALWFAFYNAPPPDDLD
jgi:hypothetical protein